jgi:hypothetical protein
MRMHRCHRRPTMGHGEGVYPDNDRNNQMVLTLIENEKLFHARRIVGWVMILNNYCTALLSFNIMPSLDLQTIDLY